MPSAALKRFVFSASRRTGLFRLAASSKMRQQRLLILCYHGISLEDEHIWNPGLYLDLETFRMRLRQLRDGAYRVLPLEEGLHHLGKGTLPPRAVVLTFDDGTCDFYVHALPLLREFGFPATLYLSTYYCRRQLPVFDPVCAYILWKSQGRSLDATGILESCNGPMEIASAPSARAVHRQICDSAKARGLSASEKDGLLSLLAERLQFDLEPLRARRFIHLMTPEEVRRTAATPGIAIELHTHRHRTPRDRALFEREIEDNRREIMELTGNSTPARHFCYPSGDYTPDFFPWLNDLGVVSATTCDTGLATAFHHRFRIPRLLDSPGRSSNELEAWLSGFNSLFQRV